MQIVAHQDDDLYFMNPSLQHDIQAGRCVQTVYVTAGDAGINQSHMRKREAGVRAAYAAMAGVRNLWIQSTIDMNGIPLLTSTLAQASEVSLVFLRLPDGTRKGVGTTLGNHESLMYLRQGSITSMTAIDGSATYTATSLTQTLTALMADFAPTIIRTLDWTIAFRSGDNPDHTGTALYARDASRDYARGHTTLAYGGYPIWTRPANVNVTDLRTKTAAMLAYAEHDPKMCQNPWCSRAFVNVMRMSRQYVVAIESATDGSGRDQRTGPIYGPMRPAREETISDRP